MARPIKSNMKNLLLILPLLIVGCASNPSILSNETLERLSKERQESALRDIEKDKEEVRATKEKISKMSDEEKILIAQKVRNQRVAEEEKVNFNTYCYDKFYGESTEISACVQIASEYISDNQNSILKLQSYLTSDKGWKLIKELAKDMREREQENLKNCMVAYAGDYDSRIECLRKANDFSEEQYESLAQAVSVAREKEKAKILADLKKRCEGYGFSGESNISACIQREAQHDKELAVQRYELKKTRLALQQAQSRAYAQNVTEPVQKEEDLPFLIKFLGDVAVGVAEAYADPNRAMIENQQQQINNLNRQRLLNSINN